jgi:cell division protein FtsB
MVNGRAMQTMLSIVGACLVGYFLYHTIEGDRGIVMQARLQAKVDTAQAELTRLQKEHEGLDHRVHLMRPESLDPDLLDEESRKTLNYSKPNEIIILSPTSTTPPTKN